MEDTTNTLEKLTITTHKSVDGDVELDYSDGSKLILVPYRIIGSIEGFDSAALYKNDALEAVATDGASKSSMPDKCGFWSKGQVTQEQLSKYCNIARVLGSRLYEDYREQKINEATWREEFFGLWKTVSESWLMRKKLELGQGKVLTEKPVRFKDVYVSYPVSTTYNY